MASSTVSSTKAERGSVTASGSQSRDPAVMDRKDTVKEEEQKNDDPTKVIAGSEEEHTTLAGLQTSSTTMLTKWLYENRPAEMTLTERLQQGKF